MFKNAFLTCIFLLLANFIFAKSFNKLDYQSYFTVEHTAKQTEYLAVNLSINLQKADFKNIVLKVFYLWEKDTITEFFPISALSAKTLKYIQKNNLTPNTEINSLELYSRNMTQIANPSQWITEIYIPIIPKTVVATTPKPTEPGKTIPTVVKPTEIPEP